MKFLIGIAVLFAGICVGVVMSGTEVIGTFSTWMNGHPVELTLTSDGTPIEVLSPREWRKVHLLNFHGRCIKFRGVVENVETQGVLGYTTVEFEGYDAPRLLVAHESTDPFGPRKDERRLILRMRKKYRLGHTYEVIGVAFYEQTRSSMTGNMLRWLHVVPFSVKDLGEAE